MEEMIGKKFNSWTILEYSHTAKGIKFFRAQCECETIHIVDGRNVKYGLSKKCVECGHKSNIAKRTGVKKSKKTPEQMRINYLYQDKRKSALQRGHSWALTLEDFEKLVFSNCFYTGLPPSTTVNVLKNKGLHSSWIGDQGYITYNGIDRVDSSKGYELGNVVTCCEWANRAKLDYTQEEFLGFCRTVAKIHAPK